MPETSSELVINDEKKAEFDLQKELAAIENKALGINVHSPIFDPKVHKAIQILITNFTLFPEEESFIDEYQYRNSCAKILSGMTKMVYIELTKLRKIASKPLETLSSVEMWALFLKYGNDLKRRRMLSQLKGQKEGIKMADTILETISKDRIAQLQYFSDYYRENDEWNRFMDATEKGLAQGLAQGESIGRQKERQEMDRDRRDSVRKMLARGISHEDISDFSGLTLEEIKALDN